MDWIRWTFIGFMVGLLVAALWLYSVRYTACREIYTQRYCVEWRWQR